MEEILQTQVVKDFFHQQLQHVIHPSPISQWLTCRQNDRSHFAVEESQRPRETPRVACHLFLWTWRSNGPRMNTWFWHVFFGFLELLLISKMLGMPLPSLSDLVQICPGKICHKNKRPQRDLQHCDPTFGQKLPWQLSSDQNPGMTFHSGWLIGILIMAYYTVIPIELGSIAPYTSPNQPFFFWSLLSWGWGFRSF